MFGIKFVLYKKLELLHQYPQLAIDMHLFLMDFNQELGQIHKTALNMLTSANVISKDSKVQNG